MGLTGMGLTCGLVTHNKGQWQGALSGWGGQGRSGRGQEVS